MHWYVDQVLRLGTSSVWARRRFLEVQGMLKDASAILHPDMLLRVLLHQLRRKSVARATREFEHHGRMPFKKSSLRSRMEELQDDNLLMESKPLI